jgi:signal transduction histidine kinase
LLDVTRIEAGQLSLKPERIAARDIVNELIESQETLAASAALKIGASVPSDLPKVWADRDRLSQILENLVGNAIKFTRPGGRIDVSARADGNQVVFSVTDTGAGIAEADLEHIFDRFWQGHQTKRRGAGLGLPIVKALVQAHGGRVWVQSTVGKGTSFFFSIPTAAGARLVDHRMHGLASS